MFNTELGIFCNLHNNWAELLVEEPYFLKVKEDGPYVMFSYDQLRSDFNLEIVREARGIIFKKGEWENPVCWAFNKFGNYGESYVPDIDWSTAFVTEKIDGSLMKVWWDGDWKISTNGTIDAFKAELNDVRMPNFGKYFLEALSNYYSGFRAFTCGLDDNLTYMFELVGPYNRVVVPHDEPDLYFLGARNNFTGEEYPCSSIIAGALGLGKFMRPAVYSLTSLNDCVKAAELKTWDDEGFVVCDANFNRVKIKSPAYVMAHYARNNNVITRKHLIHIILANEVEEFKCYAADYTEELEKVQKQISGFKQLGNELAEACRFMATKLERKDYARLVEALPKIYRGVLYYNYNGECSMEEFTKGWNENKWEEYLESFEKLGQKYFEVI